MQSCDPSIKFFSGGDRTTVNAELLSTSTVMEVHLGLDDVDTVWKGLRFSVNPESQIMFTTPVDSDLSADQVRDRLSSFDSDWSFQKLLDLDHEDPQFLSRYETVKELDLQADMCVQSRMDRSRGDLTEGLCTSCFKNVTCGDNGFTITVDGQDHFSCLQCNLDPKVDVCVAKTKMNEFTSRNTLPETLTPPTPTVSTDTDIVTTTTTPSAIVTPPTSIPAPVESDTIMRCSSCLIPPNDVVDADYHPGTRVWCKQRTLESWTNTYYKGTVQTLIDSYVSPSDGTTSRRPPRRNRFSYHIVYDNGKHDTVPGRNIRLLM